MPLRAPEIYKYDGRRTAIAIVTAPRPAEVMRIADRRKSSSPPAGGSPGSPNQASVTIRPFAQMGPTSLR